MLKATSTDDYVEAFVSIDKACAKTMTLGSWECYPNSFSNALTVAHMPNFKPSALRVFELLDGLC